MIIHTHPEYSPVKQFFPFSENDDFESLILEIQPRFIPILERICADDEVSFCNYFRVTHPEIDPIMDLISEYQSNSIILFNSEWYLCATRLEDKSNYQNIFVVPFENLITKFLDGESIEEDFFRNFGGLSQNLIPDCLRFSPKLYLSNGDYFDADGNELTVYPIWSTCDGIDFVMAASGEVYLFYGDRKQAVTETFSQFLAMFSSNCRLRGRNWFDFIIA